MQKVLKTILWLLPLIFGVGFLAPVIAAGLAAAKLDPPFGFSAIAFGLVIGGGWGAFATLKGRWV
jgi:hypothetical protein